MRLLGRLGLIGLRWLIGLRLERLGLLLLIRLGLIGLRLRLVRRELRVIFIIIITSRNLRRRGS